MSLLGIRPETILNFSQTLHSAYRGKNHPHDDNHGDNDETLEPERDTVPPTQKNLPMHRLLHQESLGITHCYGKVKVPMTDPRFQAGPKKSKEGNLLIPPAQLQILLASILGRRGITAGDLIPMLVSFTIRAFISGQREVQRIKHRP